MVARLHHHDEAGEEDVVCQWRTKSPSPSRTILTSKTGDIPAFLFQWAEHETGWCGCGRASWGRRAFCSHIRAPAGVTQARPWPSSGCSSWSHVKEYVWTEEKQAVQSEHGDGGGLGKGERTRNLHRPPQPSCQSVRSTHLSCHLGRLPGLHRCLMFGRRRGTGEIDGCEQSRAGSRARCFMMDGIPRL
jgi:hypothetical protein